MASCHKTPGGDYVLVLSPGERKALLVLTNYASTAIEGSTAAEIRGRFGQPAEIKAGERAVDALRKA